MEHHIINKKERKVWGKIYIDVFRKTNPNTLPNLYTSNIRNHPKAKDA